MLKLKANETLTGVIDNSNKVFVSDNYIAKVNSITVDGNAVTSANYTIDRFTITLTTAPVTSIVLDHFYREELDIIGEGLVELGDITKEVYEELGRNDLSKVYVKTRVETMINKSLKRITNKTSEKKSVQHYALEGLNGFIITKLDTDGLTGSNILGVGIEGAILAGDSAYIPYTAFNGTKFTTQLGVDTILKVGERAIVGHRIPYGVQKITRIYVDNHELSFIDNQEFDTNTRAFFTIIKGKDGNEYLFLPYSEKAYTLVVKYVPDRKILSNETDVVDIPYEYTTVIVYDVIYRLMISREDDRKGDYKTLLYGDNQEPGMLKEYRSFIKEQVKKTRGVIKTAVVISNNTFGIIKNRAFNINDTL